LNEQEKDSRVARELIIDAILEAYRDLGITEAFLPREEGQATDITTGPDPRVQAVEELRTGDLGPCSRCKLHKTRRTIVFGEGNPCADLMLIGEAPGADEDLQGRPFVGRAGQLLMQMIKAIRLERKDVYIANVLKCRPPANRPPEPDEIAACSPFLRKQIAVIRPKLILALGTFSAQLLLESRSPISALRNRVYEMPFGRVLATFHPSFLLRSPQMKPQAWEDLKLARRILDEQSYAGGKSADLPA
jgi:uracil-DNA glycosylase family 4